MCLQNLFSLEERSGEVSLPLELDTLESRSGKILIIYGMKNAWISDIQKYVH